MKPGTWLLLAGIAMALGGIVTNASGIVVLGFCVFAAGIVLLEIDRW